ncbi:MAG: hypothetical protein AB7S65_11295 [Sulfuricurvum sp.]
MIQRKDAAISAAVRREFSLHVRKVESKKRYRRPRERHHLHSAAHD